MTDPQPIAHPLAPSRSDALPDGAARLEMAGTSLAPLPSGALWWPGARLLCLGDMHLGRSGRMARQGNALLPPYETEDTLGRLSALVDALAPEVVVCLGDSFDDDEAARGLGQGIGARLARLAAGRDWIWVAGNHDPAPHGLPGRAVPGHRLNGIGFRHIARAQPPAPGEAEVSAHFHPKARLFHKGRRVSRPCFLADQQRLILPAFGTYTGGLDAGDAAFDRLFAGPTEVLMTGRRIVRLPRAALA